MNLSSLQRMIGAKDISFDALLYCLNCKGECEFLDHKKELNLENDKALCDFSKDVVAMRNTGGGYLVIGVEDKTWKPVGINDPLRYDLKLLRDKVRKATGLEIELYVVEHNVHIDRSLKRFALILVQGMSRRKVKHIPCLIKSDFCHKEKYGLRRGEIYFRQGDSTTLVTDPNQLGKLLDDFDQQITQDELNISNNQLQFAIEDGTYYLLEKGFETFIGRSFFKEKIIEAVAKDPRMWIVNIHGPGGVGKSAIVNWVAYYFYENKEFDAILQLTAKDKVLTPTGIKQCGRTLYSLENLLDNILEKYWGEIPELLDKKIEICNLILSEYKALIILDNMETVEDGRILQFIQNLPIENKSKIVLTSRTQTGGWELPIAISELDRSEAKEFIINKAAELSIQFPLDELSCQRITEASGGLPLAIQWILGSFVREPDIDKILGVAKRKESPVLEFTFGNIWKLLQPDAKTVLAIMPIFESPPTLQQLSISLDYSTEKIEAALDELIKMTLITKLTQEPTGRIVFAALPITIAFAVHRLAEMEGLEAACRKMFNKFTHEVALNAADIRTFLGKFERYGIENDNEKRAILLCQRGESAMFAGKTEDAECHFKEARDLAPLSAYVFAMSASYELSRNRISSAITMIDQAIKKKTKKTAALCYTIKARIFEAQRDWLGKVRELGLAVEAAPDDHYIRHQYGVALSKNGHPQKAIDQFTEIIDAEKKNDIPTRALMFALKTRMINLRRLNRHDEFTHDLARVNEIIRMNPGLVEHAQDFLEFVHDAE